MNEAQRIARNAEKLADLEPATKAKVERLLELAKDEWGVRLLVTDAYRSFEEQEELFWQGRNSPGKVVTKARAGQSWHNFGRAVDVAVVREDGSLSFDIRGDWPEKCADDCGLEWGGDWVKFVDENHFQFTAGMTLREANAKRYGWTKAGEG